MNAVDERLTPERLAELRAGAEKATPGEWNLLEGPGCFYVKSAAETFDFSGPHPQPVALMCKNYDIDTTRIREGREQANATHIANFSPSTAIALIDALEAARKEIAGLREGLWQDIETAPKDGSSFLVPYHGRVAICRWGVGTYDRSTKSYPEAWCVGRDNRFAPKLWQPLPALPSALLAGGDSNE